MEIKLLLKELSKLNLPVGQYAITASATLAARDIREAGDLDVIVTDDLWNELRQKHTVNPKTPYIMDIGHVSILGKGSAFRDQGIATVDELINNAEEIHGFPFVKLEYIKRFKEKLGREKDFNDIKLIDEYLDNHA